MSCFCSAHVLASACPALTCGFSARGPTASAPALTLSLELELGSPGPCVAERGGWKSRGALDPLLPLIFCLAPWKGPSRPRLHLCGGETWARGCGTCRQPVVTP